MNDTLWLKRLVAYMCSEKKEDDEDIYAMEIPEAKKRNVLDKLNPLLEELVTQVMIDLPENPAEFMLIYLVNKAQIDDLDELENCKRRNKKLKKKLANLREKMRKIELHEGLRKMELDKSIPPSQ